MPFVQRDTGGVVVGLHLNMSPDATEFLPDSDPEVIACRAKIAAVPPGAAINQKLKAALVEVGTLTQARADAIFG